MSRPTRPPGPPYPRAYPASRIRRSRTRTSPTARAEPYPDARQPPPPPPAQPRFTPRPGPQQHPYPGPPQAESRQPGRRSVRPGRSSAPAPPPGPHAPRPRAQPAATADAPRRRSRRRPRATPPASRRSPPTPGADGPAAGRARASRPGRDAPPADGRRRETAPPPTAFFSPAPGRVPAGAGPGGVRLRADRWPRVSPRSTGRPSRTTRTTAPGSSSVRSARRRSTGPQRTADDTSPNLARSSKAMAFGTIASRGTGFLRTLVLVVALGGAQLADAYNNSNTLPNTVYYLMLGGIFTAVVVPLLVRAAREDPDRGEGYAERIFTIGVISLLVVTVLGTLLAGPLVDLYAGNINGMPGIVGRRRAPPHGGLRLLLHPADLLLRDGRAARRDPEHQGPVRRQHVDAGHQQRRGHHRRRAVHPDRGAAPHAADRSRAAASSCSPSAPRSAS